MDYRTGGTPASKERDAQAGLRTGRFLGIWCLAVGSVIRTLRSMLTHASHEDGLDISDVLREIGTARHPYFNGSSKPYVRWWWLCGPFRDADMAQQLDWLRDHGFGGVEIAWIAPSWLSGEAPRPGWLSPEWTRLVAVANRLAKERNLGCDFTFGSCWPFGGTHVSAEDASQNFGGPSPERLQCSWEDGEAGECRIVNHLSAGALKRYADRLLAALGPALDGGGSALFCDSLEVDTRGLWDRELWDVFASRFGYRLEPFARALDSHPDVRYDYRKLIAETMTREFYAAFSSTCRKAGVHARVQCHGSPTDLISSYGAVEIPETETLLFEPVFARIASSAAAAHGKPVVSCETFTCIYGFSHLRDPALHRLWKREDLLDLRLLADAVIANGVNQVVWHGMPYNPPGQNVEFYAAVHVGPDSGIADSLFQLNRYLTHLCGVMQGGRTHSQVAVYIPNEDNWMEGAIPPEERTPGATQRWQMRHVAMPKDVEGYHPLWVSTNVLATAQVCDKALLVGDLSFEALYVDSNWMDADGLAQVHRLASAGLPVVVRRRPRPPGHRPGAEYGNMVTSLLRLPSVVSSMEECRIPPFASGAELPFHWARDIDGATYVFLAHPEARRISYPMKYQQAHAAKTCSVRMRFRCGGRDHDVRVRFGPSRSALLRLNADGSHRYIDLRW